MLFNGAEPECSEVLFYVDIRHRLHERAEDYFGVVLEVDLQTKTSLELYTRYKPNYDDADADGAIEEESCLH